MDLGISQKELARRLGADEWSVHNWEVSRTQPAVRFMPAILGFLDHDPLPVGKTFGDRLRGARRRLGLTQAELGRQVGISEGGVYDLEHGRQAPTSKSGVAAAQYLRIT